MSPLADLHRLPSVRGHRDGALLEDKSGEELSSLEDNSSGEMVADVAKGEEVGTLDVPVDINGHGRRCEGWGEVMRLVAAFSIAV